MESVNKTKQELIDELATLRKRDHNSMIQTICMNGDISSFLTSLMEEEKKYPVSFFEKLFSLMRLTQFVSRSTAEPMLENAVYGSL